MFEIVFDKRIAKESKNLPKKELVKILDKINKKLAENPFPKGANPKKLKGGNGYRLRIGNYRAMYKIDKNTVEIYSIDHRKDAYKN